VRLGEGIGNARPGDLVSEPFKNCCSQDHAATLGNGCSSCGAGSEEGGVGEEGGPLTQNWGGTEESGDRALLKGTFRPDGQETEALCPPSREGGRDCPNTQSWEEATLNNDREITQNERASRFSNNPKRDAIEQAAAALSEARMTFIAEKKKIKNGFSAPRTAQKNWNHKRDAAKGGAAVPSMVSVGAQRLVLDERGGKFALLQERLELKHRRGGQAAKRKKRIKPAAAKKKGTNRYQEGPVVVEQGTYKGSACPADGGCRTGTESRDRLARSEPREPCERGRERTAL